MTARPTALVIVPAKDTSKKAKEIGGIDTLRHPDENGMHFGNPFSHTNHVGVQKVMPTVKEAVLAFEKWLSGEEYQDVEPERRQWIINQINSGVLIGKPLVYYTENIPDNSWGVSTYNYHTAPNHAHILQKLINEKSLNLKSDKTQIFEDEKPEITEPNIPKTNIQGEEVDQQITITPVGKFIPEYGNIYRVNVENLINELTVLDELKLDGTINLKDLILLPDITEKNIPLIAKLCASPYFNKSKQGVETIELTDEALQKAAKRHSKVLKYKKDKETGKVTITVPKSFIVGYT